MNLYLYVLTGVLCITLAAAEVGLHQYLRKNLNNFVEPLEENSPKKSPGDFILELSFHPSSRFSEALEDVPNVHTYTLFNDTFITMENEIFIATLNKSLKMESVGNLDHTSFIYLKVIEFENTGYMALSTTNEVTFYKIINNKPSFLHSISSSKSSAGSFFLNQENLYFLSGTNNDQCGSSLKVFKWLGSHFDQTHSITVPSINIINTFTYNEFEVIILCHSDAITVYLFNQKTLRKIQHLDGTTATHLDMFVQNGIPYILTYELGKQNLYRWSGFEMVLDNTFNWDHFGKSLVVYMNSTPYIVQPQLDHLLVLKPKGKQIIRHKNMRYFNNFSTVLGIDKGRNSKGNITFIVGLNDDNIINIYAMSFEADAGIEADQEGMLPKCLDNLETKLNERKKKSNNVATKHLQKRQVHQEDTNIQNKWNNIVNSLNELKVVLSLKENVSQFAVNTNVVIQNITLKTATAKQWKCNFLNGKKWTPVSWLAINGTQVINGFVKVHTLKTRNITNIHNNTIFNRMLTKNMISTRENLHVKKLVVPKMYTETINDIQVSSIAKINSSLALRGVKTFKNITTLIAQIETLNGITTEIDTFKFAPHVIVDSIQVNSVNGINWNEFKNQTFKIDENTNITGNITIPKLITSTLKTTLLNKVPVKNLLTVTTKQNVTPTVIFNHIQVNSISCDTLNNVNISNIVQLDQDTSVKGKVVVENLFVAHLVTLGEKHVITSNFYAKDFLISPMAMLNISGELYSFENLSNYWSKNDNQSIPVHFEALEGMSVQHLQTFLLNEVPVGVYATNNQTTTITGPLFLENAIVIGNVTVENNETKSFLEKIYSEGVRKHGAEYIIKGKKIVNGELTAHHLETFEEKHKNVTRDQGYNSVIVKGNFSGTIETETINNISSLTNSTSWNKPLNLTSLSLNNVTVQNLHVKSIHGINVEDYLKKLDYILKSKQLGNVSVTGNLTVFKIETLKTINSFDVVDLLNKKTFDLKGDLRFTGKVYVNQLKTRVINKIDLPVLISRCFHQKFNQTVTGRFTFVDLKTEHLHTELINDVNVTTLIDTTDASQIITSGIIVNNSVFSSIKSSKMEPCNIYQAMESILSPQTREWSEVEIIGNVTLIDTNSDIKRILENTVHLTKSNTISAPVFIAGDITSKKVDLQGELNEVSLKKLIEDVVLVDAKNEQFITGRKTFANKLFADLVIVEENADIFAIQDMEVRELYKRIISNDEVNDLIILGKKTFFAGLQTDKFMTNKISGLLPDDVVSLSNSTFTVPEVIFDSLNITNTLTIKEINNYNLNTILNNRLLLNKTERQVTNALNYFSTVTIQDKLQVPAINNIQIKKVVFDMDQQEITEPKHFMHDLTINGNLSVNYYNLIALPTAFKNSVLRSSNSTVNSTLSVLKSAEFQGNLTAVKINNFSLDYVDSALQSPKIQEKKITAIIDEAQKVIQLSSTKLKSRGEEFMYIQNTENFQVKNNKAVDVKITVIQDYSLVHITSEESHDKCNLPKGCECLVQQSLEITPDLSVNYLPNEIPHQRVFSFNNEYVTVHVFINSVSRSSECRLNNTNETVSLITWNVKGNSTKNNYVFPLSFTDYISDVGFFTMNGTSYLMITRFYDPLLDTHHLNSTLYKLSYDKEYVSEVQNITTDKASSLHIMESEQGIILVIANQAETPFTNIFKFDQHKEKFELLRIWPYGCIKAQGIVLAEDSFLILASNDATVWILKYHHKWNNYYAYQQIVFDETVVSLSSFYLEGFNTREAFLSVVTQNGYYHMYKFYYTDGWVLEFEGIRTGLKGLVPFELDNQLYLFAPSISEYLFLKVVTR